MTRFRKAGFALSVALFGFVAVEGVSRAAAPRAPDLEKGKALYEECKGCHGLGDNVVGPRHCGVMGRHAGSVPDFTYSDVMKNAKIVWTDDKLHEFLTSPLSYLSGTNMGFAGLFDINERNDVIAYLKQVSDDPACAAVPADAKGKH
jgi:cytochrome c